MKTPLQSKFSGNIHPILELVKRKDAVNLPQVVYILKKRKHGDTYRQIQKDLLKDTGSDISIQRIGQISLQYKEAMNYV